jgi:6-phosphofructokinase
VGDYGYCVIVVSEGARRRTASSWPTPAPRTHSATRSSAAWRRWLPAWCNEALGYKYHWAVADYLQRAARHVASKVDVEQAYAVGKAAVEYAVKGMNAVMPGIKRRSSRPIAGRSFRCRWRGRQRREESAA